jgi:hypothetical protein
MKSVIQTIRRVVGVLVVVVLLAIAQPLRAQPPSAASQDGFVPVSQTTQPQETIPAPRLVAIAYGFAWVMLLGYLWSIWSRLGKVEREMQAVSRRAGSGGR